MTGDTESAIGLVSRYNDKVDIVEPKPRHKIVLIDAGKKLKAKAERYVRGVCQYWIDHWI